MRSKSVALSAGFLACILLANYVTTEYGMIPVGFGLMATAGTYLAGATFVLRDSLQDAAGKGAVFVAILAGFALSLVISAPAIAAASAAAFLLSETTDLLVYTPLRKRGYVRAAIASNIVGSTVDTFVFLAIAGFPIAQAFGGQIVGKLTITLIAVAAVSVYRVRKFKYAS